MKNKWLIAVLIISVIIALIGCSKATPTATPVQTVAPTTPTPTPKTIVWKAQDSYVPAPIPSYFPKDWDLKSAGTGSCSEAWINKIESLSDGLIKIELAPSGSIVPVTDAFTALSNGVIDCIPMHFGGYYAGVLPEAEAEMLPYAIIYLWEYYDFYRYKGGAKFMEEAHAKFNVKWLPYPLSGAYTITSVKPIRTLADMKGMKLRTSGAPGAAAAAAGAAPVTMAYADIYMALKLGTIDGVLSGPIYLEDQKAYEVIKYMISYPPITQMSCNTLINMNSFKALPQYLQDRINKYMWDIAIDNSQKYRVQEEWIVKYAVEKYGMELISWSEADATQMRKLAAEKAWTTIAAKGAGAAKFVEMQVNFLKEAGKIK